MKPLPLTVRQAGHLPLPPTGREDGGTALLGGTWLAPARAPQDWAGPVTPGAQPPRWVLVLPVRPRWLCCALENVSPQSAFCLVPLRY